MTEVVLWGIFGAVVAVMLFLDLAVFHRKSHIVKLREAALWSAIWVALALGFSVGVYLFLGGQQGKEFLTAYLIEKSLSVDNLFVFSVIFSYFAVPSQYQHRVLFWGILGALVMRGTLIASGVALLEAIHWVTFLFGAFLLLTSVKLALEKAGTVHPEKNTAVRLFRKVFPTIPGYEGNRFFVRRGGKSFATVLFLALLVVESTDLVFAVDSIPAVLAISTDPFIVYTSNIFAILGLRALYFLLAGVMPHFHYLRTGLAVILAFVGVKMLVTDFYKMPVELSLGVIAGVLVAAIVASMVRQRRMRAQGKVELGRPQTRALRIKP